MHNMIRVSKGRFWHSNLFFRGQGGIFYAPGKIKDEINIYSGRGVV